MKFTRYILKVMVPEWIKLYINFALLKTYLSVSTKLKNLLVLAKKTKSNNEYRRIKAFISSQILLIDKMKFDNSQFIDSLQEEVEIIESFVSWKSNDLQMKMYQLKSQIKSMKEAKENLYDNYEQHLILNNSKQHQKVSGIEQIDSSFLIYRKKAITFHEFERNKNQLLETFYTFYNECIHFQSYVDVNCEGIRKIQKKYKKSMIKGIRKNKDELINQLNSIVNAMSHTPDQITNLLYDTEHIMISNFYQNQQKKCRENLRKYSSSKLIELHTFFEFGLFTGLALILLIIIMFMIYEGYLNPKEDLIFIELFPCFRGIALFLIYYWGLALDVMAWNYFKINYKIYLGFNHHFSTLSQILKRVTTFSTLFLIVFVTYCLQAKNLGNLLNDIKFVDPKYLPLIVWLTCIFYVLIPTKIIWNGEGRRWMFKMIRGSVVGHFVKYESRYTFFTEQFVSLVIPFSDLDYTICFYLKDETELVRCGIQYRYAPLLACVLPFLIICVQQITRARDKNHFWSTLEMLNFFKNLLVMQLGIVAQISYTNINMQYLWVLLAILCTFLTFWWDVRQDWLLFEPNAKYKFLRDDLGYNNPNFYYFLVALNLILRGVWTFSISPIMLIIFFGHQQNIQMIVYIVGILELIRRSLSNFLKIEKEHITNQNLFKTVVDYKYPFEQYQGQKLSDLNESHISVSTINKNNGLEYRRKVSVEDSPLGRLDRSEVSISFAKPIKSAIKRKESIDSNLDQSQMLISDKQNKQSQKRVSRLFRLTYYVKNEQEKIHTHDYQNISHKQINLQILDQAKDQELYQNKKIHQMRESNKLFKELITNIYTEFNLPNSSKQKKKQFQQLDFFNWI